VYRADERKREEPADPTWYLLERLECNRVAWRRRTSGRQRRQSCRLHTGDFLNLKTLDVVLRDETRNEDAVRSWVTFCRLLQRPWFERRWVIQEVAYARRLSVRIGTDVLSWLDFADALDLYLAKIDRLRELYSHSTIFKTKSSARDGIEGSKAMALLKLSSSVFQKSSDSVVMPRLISLESPVLTPSSFAVSDAQDIVYALLYLANDRYDIMSSSYISPVDYTLTSDYIKHAADTSLHFTRYCMVRSQPFDIICRRWAYWPRPHLYSQYNKRFHPTWSGTASYGGAGHPQRTMPEDLVGLVGSRVYDASRGVALRAHTPFPTFKHVIQAEGVVLGIVKKKSAVISGGRLHKHCIRMLGWDGTLNNGVNDKIWRTLVMNRSPDGKTAPTWYRRACALALTKIDANGILNIADLVADNSQSSTMIDYLRRVWTATQYRKVFHCTSFHMIADTRASLGLEDTVVGLGPEDMKCYDEDLVCILFGCSVPVVLRHCHFYGTGTRHVVFVGACYVHGHIEREMFAGTSKEEIRSKAATLNIY
jgi:hypothetical protein